MPFQVQTNHINVFTGIKQIDGFPGVFEYEN